jgi:hypothetical protein
VTIAKRPSIGRGTGGLLKAICPTAQAKFWVAIMGSGKPDNARPVSATIRDAREVWASYFLPQHRSRILEQLADYTKRVPDETARIDLDDFTAAIQAVN